MPILDDIINDINDSIGNDKPQVSQTTHNENLHSASLIEDDVFGPLGSQAAELETVATSDMESMTSYQVDESHLEDETGGNSATAMLSSSTSSSTSTNSAMVSIWEI